MPPWFGGAFPAVPQPRSQRDAHREFQASGI